MRAIDYNNDIRLGVVGLGYMGLVTAVGLALKGYDVVGFEKTPDRKTPIINGEIPFFEPGLQEAFDSAKDRFTVASSMDELVSQSDVFFICVGTPVDREGKIELSYLMDAVDELVRSLRRTDKRDFIVVVRSTVIPGTGEKVVEKIEEAGYVCGKDFGYASYPEFLREGSALKDFLEPHKIVFGASDIRTEGILTEIFSKFPAPLFALPVRESETLKYLDNIWHAVKVVFANEVLRASEVFDVDAFRLMRVFCEDTKLNISPAYLRPGFAFGGSCLPKDLKAFVSAVKERKGDDLLPMLKSVIFSNEVHIERIRDWIAGVAEKLGLRKLFVVGLAFKPQTDDCRESPAIKLSEALLSLQFPLKVYDPLVDYDRAKSCFPELSLLQPEHWCSLEEGLSWADAVVLTGSFVNRDVLSCGKPIFDLNRAVPLGFSGEVLCPFQSP